MPRGGQCLQDRENALRLRVFVVEDLVPAQALLNELFDANGDNYEVVGSSTTEAEANDWLAENIGQWDMVVTDLVLAQGNGISVARRARKLQANAMVVVLSGYASPGICKHLLDLGADRVFDKADMAGFVQWLGQPGQRAEAAHAPAP